MHHAVDLDDRLDGLRLDALVEPVHQAALGQHLFADLPLDVQQDRGDFLLGLRDRPVPSRLLGFECPKRFFADVPEELAFAGDGLRERLLVTGDHVEPVEVNKHGAVVGCAGGGQYAADGEFLVVHVTVGSAVDEFQLRADIPAVLTGHDRSDGCVKRVANQALAGVFAVQAPGPELEFSWCPVRLVHVGQHEVVGGGPHDREGTLPGHVAHRDRDRPVDPVARLGGQLAVETVGQGFSGHTDPVDAGEHQLQLAALGSENQVVAGGRLDEHPFGHPVGDQDHDHQHHSQCH